jgi:hypothetical protein
MLTIQTEIKLPMDGWQILGISLEVTRITYQTMKIGYAPLISTEIYTESESQTSWVILQINFVSLREMEIIGLNTSYSMGAYVPESLTGSGEFTRGAMRIGITAMFHLIKNRVKQMAHSLTSLC